MLAMIFSILGNLCSSICLSVVSLLLFRLFLRSSTGSRSSLFRRMMRASFYFYSSVLNWLRPYVAQISGLDLLAQLPRILSTIGLSLLIGWGGSALVGLSLPTWLLVLLLLHGAYVGWSWEHIILPDDFHLGSRLE